MIRFSFLCLILLALLNFVSSDRLRRYAVNSFSKSLNSTILSEINYSKTFYQVPQVLFDHSGNTLRPLGIPSRNLEVATGTSDDNSPISDPVNNSIISDPKDNSTISDPVNNSTISDPKDNSTVSDPKDNSTISDPVNNSTTNNPPVNNSTTNNPPVNNSTTNNPPVNNSTTNNPPVNNSTTNNPPVNNSTTNNPPVNNSTTIPTAPGGSTPTPISDDPTGGTDTENNGWDNSSGDDTTESSGSYTPYIISAVGLVVLTAIIFCIAKSGSKKNKPATSPTLELKTNKGTKGKQVYSSGGKLSRSEAPL